MSSVSFFTYLLFLFIGYVARFRLWFEDVMEERGDAVDYVAAVVFGGGELKRFTR